MLKDSKEYIDALKRAREYCDKFSQTLDHDVFAYRCVTRVYIVMVALMLVTWGGHLLECISIVMCYTFVMLLQYLLRVLRTIFDYQGGCSHQSLHLIRFVITHYDD